MSDRPRLDTHRLRLRPFLESDAPRVRELAGAYEVALNTLSVPHPYPEGAAEAWIATHEALAATGHHPTAVTLLATGELVGVVGLHATDAPDDLELGYWIGVPYWGNGYATEAARAMIDWAFTSRPELERIHAHHFARNPASGGVLRKCGMRYLDTVADAVEKWGEMQDVNRYEILRSDWAALRDGAARGVAMVPAGGGG